MTGFLVRRLLQTLVTLFMVTVITFVLCQVLPGDPALARAGSEGASKELIEAARKDLGLDQPLPVQYAKWMGAMLTGDFGLSTRSRVPVTELFAQRLPVTLEVLVFAVIYALALGIPLGVISALYANTWIDTTGTVIAVTGVAMPQYFQGMLLILVLSVWLGWLPASGYVPPSQGLWANLLGMVMPAITLGSVVAAEVMRQLRSSMLEVLGEEYVQTARAKGVSESGVILRHALRNALIPVVTIIGMRIGRLIGGIVVIEVVFSMPGIGQLLMNSVLNNDFPVVQAGVLMVAVVVTLINLVTDVSYMFIDPRIRHA